MRPFPKHPGNDRTKRTTASHTRPSPSLDDGRYLDLMQKAGAFFAAAERDVEAEKAAAITEIQGLMMEYGITVEDLSTDL